MMPNLSNAIRRFEDTLQFTLVKKTVTDGDVAESSQVKPVLWFEGILQPTPPSALLVKSEGERAWQWWMLYTDLDLDKDNIIKDETGRIFRVMTDNDWNHAGYFSYELIEGPGV